MTIVQLSHQITELVQPVPYPVSNTGLCQKLYKKLWSKEVLEKNASKIALVSF